MTEQAELPIPSWRGQGLMYANSGELTIEHEFLTLREKIFSWAKGSCWASGDTMSDVGEFASGVAAIAVGHSSARVVVELGEDSTIGITVPGADTTGYLLRITEWEPGKTRLRLELYYQGINLPMPKRGASGWECHLQLEALATRFCATKAEKRLQQETEWKAESEARAAQYRKEREWERRRSQGLCEFCGNRKTWMERMLGGRAQGHNHKRCKVYIEPKD